MGRVKEEMIRHIDAAIDFENKGKAFYLDVMGRTPNQYSKMMFERLAREEETHAELLTRMKQELTEERQVEEELINVVEPADFEEVFALRKSAIARVGEDYTSALSYAMQAEEKAQQAYARLREMSDNDVMRKIFQRLADFERAHYDSLKAELEFIRSNPMSM